MPALSVRNLTMTFIERNLFTDVSFDVEERDKVGFIGANGVGKTTLFKILNGEISPVSGTVTFSKNVRPGYMEQHACNNPRADVYHELLSVFDYLSDMETEISALAHQIDNKSGNLDELVERQTMLIEQFERAGGLTYKSRTRSALLGLGFSENDFTMPVGNLSGGQRSKLCLAKLLLSQSNMLLLDEPTNHLDIDAISWLEGFLRDFKGAMIIISHDRYFLDNVTNKTIELEHNRAMVYKGSYSEFVKKKESVNESLKNKYEHDLKEIKRIEGIVEQQKRWGQAHNFITAASKQKEADRIKDGLVAPESELETMRMHFEPRCESGNDVLICKNLAKSFDNKQLFKNVDIHIRKGERVFIIGGNGCGKTTLFRILTGKTPMNSGEYDYGANVEIGYFDQMQQNLDLSKTALDEVWDTFPNMTQTEVRSALASFLFKGDEVFKPLSKMSGGERARVSLLKLMLKGSNFLLLDEPTNHLDASSREELEKTLLDYSGTMLIVSHDRYFVNEVADRIWEFEDLEVKDYKGNYDFYLEEKQKKAAALAQAQEEAEKAAAYAEAQAKKQQQTAATPVKSKKQEDKKRRYSPDEAARLLPKVELQIREQEAMMGLLEKQMADPANHTSPEHSAAMAAEHEEYEQTIAELMEKWELLMEAAEDA